MRSKAAAARSSGGEKAIAAPSGQRISQPAGSLALVGVTDARPVAAMKPGLY